MLLEFWSFDCIPCMPVLSVVRGWYMTYGDQGLKISVLAPQAVRTALFATAKGPLGRVEHLYRDVAATTGGSWKLLAAADWMQCKADPRYSPVQGEKLGTVNRDGTSYATW